MSKYESMSDEVLIELAKGKVKKTGLFKQTALQAQRELWNRHHWSTNDYVPDDVTDSTIEERQYNG